MSKYIIGIIDDEPFNVKTIRGTIKIHATEDVGFKTYLLNELDEVSISKIYKEVLKDIENNSISTLIIDEKIISNSNEIRGSEIFAKIKQKVDKFPMIILTNFPDDCMNDNIIDPDKIYKKIDFLNIDSDTSKELVKKIFLNAQKYMEQRCIVEQKIKELEEQIENNGYKSQIVTDIIENEEMLQNLRPTDFRQIEKLMKPDEIKEILELIKEANDLTE
ncbi:MAG: hypothetical protein IKL55_02010 [Clostridia bacterium]|nr:hypothetical protein [Clostridia bacterium]